jgi:hypothetical protein
MKKTYDQVIEEKVKKLKGYLFNTVVNRDNIERMPFNSVLKYGIETFKLGYVGRKDYNRLYRYFTKLKKKRDKLVEERRISEEFLITVYKKLQNKEITYEYARKILDIAKPYIGSTKYSEWKKIFLSLDDKG